MLRFKPTVRIVGYSPALHRILTVLVDLENQHVVRPELVVTSIHDSTHAPDSRHYTDDALDLRCHDLNPEERARLIENLRIELGDRFTVLLEDPGGENEHLHLQVRKGQKYP